MIGWCWLGFWGVRAGLSGPLCSPSRLLNTSEGHKPLMGLKPLREPLMKWRGSAERSTPVAGTTDSPRSVFTSFGLGWKEMKGPARGARSGVRGMVMGRMAGCREQRRK